MIIAANLKTNLTRKETQTYIEKVEILQTQNEVLVFPAMSSLIEHSGSVRVGAQNAYATQEGAFTGEIGFKHLEEFGINTLLIGHSERRHILGETQEELVKKFNFYKDLGFTIVYCVGEPLDKRKAGEEEMMEYITSQYEGIDTEYENLIIAYEPVWAIGTGLTPSLKEIQEMHTALKEKSKAPLLYGGSVKKETAKVIMALENVDGVLVGSAALKVEDFMEMVG